jgi:hypothetical protein
MTSFILSDSEVVCLIGTGLIVAGLYMVLFDVLSDYGKDPLKQPPEMLKPLERESSRLGLIFGASGIVILVLGLLMSKDDNFNQRCHLFTKSYKLTKQHLTQS